jgi:hypothetical protein
MDCADDLITRPILFYFPGSPVLNTAGSQARAKWLLKVLAARFGNLTFYSYRNGPSWPWVGDAEETFRTQFPGIELILEHDGPLLRRWKSVKNLLVALFPGQAGRILSWRLPFCTDALRRYFARCPDAIVLCNYVDGLTQLNGLGRKPYIVDTHDIKFVHFLKLTKTKKVTDLSVLLKMRGEMACLANACGIVAISPAEEKMLRMLISDVPTYYIPAAPEPIALPACKQHRYDLLFVGSSVALNVEGISTFIAEHDAWLARYRLAICGDVCDVESIRALCRGRPNLSLLGVVRDLNVPFSEAKCAISPVEGTGLKIKVVDALARGKPVFASRQSFDGLTPGYDGCVLPTDEAVMSQILDDPAALQAAETAAVRYYEQFRQGGELEALLDRLRTFGR